MRKMLAAFDELVGIDDATSIGAFARRIAFLFVTIMLLAAPHSIAATNISFGIALVAFIVGHIAQPKAQAKWRKFHAVELALIALFIWSVVSAVFSHDQATSLSRLKHPALFLIAVLVFRVITNIRAAYFLTAALIFSTTTLALIAPIYRIIGRGVEIKLVEPAGPLAKAGFVDGDTILRVNGKRISDPAELLAAIDGGKTATVAYHRPDIHENVEVDGKLLLPGTTPSERLGFCTWATSHYWRSAGFFSHYTTFAEFLQIVASLAFGVLLVLYQRRREADKPPNFVFSLPFLIVSLILLGTALLLSGTRASQLSFGVAAFVLFLTSVGRRTAVFALVLAIPIAIAAGFLIQSTRNVGFFDTKDAGTQYRFMMWRDGVRIWSESPRNIVFGVGMDSIKTHWQEWGMFDGGRVMMGHFHSLPVQLLVERGLPALLIWLTVLGIFARSMWRGRRGSSPVNAGIMLGCLGATIGFFTSGFLHNNLGDAEVANAFYIILGLGLGVSTFNRTDS